MPSAKLPRPVQVVTALRRLGYVDKPATGDHIRVFKVLDHPSGPVTITVGLDLGHTGKSDVDRIRDRTKLIDDVMWEQALNKDLPADEYDDYLRSLERSDLVIEFFRNVVAAKDATPKPDKSAPRRKRKSVPRRQGRRR